MDAMRIHYNFIRPNQAIGGQTPAEAAGINLNLGENKVESLMRQAAVYGKEVQQEPIVVERGVTKSIPLRVEAPNDAEKTLQVRLTSGAGTIDPAQLNAELSQTTLVLSKLDLAQGKVTELGSGRGIRDAGILTLNPPASTPPGEYSFMIEAEQQANGELAETLGSGALVYVTVK